MNEIGENIWLRSYPFSTFGMQMGRNVAVIRLSSGKLVIHSTAAFTDQDVTDIRKLGEPSWLLDATNLHDTYAVKGVKTFSDIPYLAPAGFPVARKVGATSLEQIPSEWNGELDVIPVLGMPKINEHVVFHRESGTLIVADLLFNLPPDIDGWTRKSVQLLSGIREYPGNSRMFRLMIRDREAFEGSLQEILSLKFNRVVVGHGLSIEKDARKALRQIFSNQGFAV